MSTTGNYLLLAGVSATTLLFAAAWGRALLALIARRNLHIARQRLRAGQWELLRRTITLGSYPWRFASRPYILMVGLAARAKLTDPSVQHWVADADCARVLREADADDMLSDRGKLAEYLDSHVRGDETLLPVSKAMLWFLGSTVGLTIALAALTFAAARIELQNR
jgi:hypothetical protein